MEKTILLLESRDLCYESNHYFMGYLEDALEQMGYRTEICDLSVRMEEQLEGILERQETYLAAFDFNSFLPRLQLEDGTPYLDAFCVPFFNWLVDHPLYHHIGLKRQFARYGVICIDLCHKQYIEKYYPHIKHVFYLPLGGTKAASERSFDQKRLELLFLGTYEPEEKLYQELQEYPKELRHEVSALIEMMREDFELTQEDALERYLDLRGESLHREAFAKRLNGDYLADKYLRNFRRKETLLAAADAEVPFTVAGHGWDLVKELDHSHITIRSGVGYAASIQIMADARMLLNTTPGFHGGLHDRVYSAMMNHTLCFTEKSTFAEKTLSDGRDTVLYDLGRPDMLAEKIRELYEHPQKAEHITKQAYVKAKEQHTWQKRAEEIIKNIKFL